MTTCSRLRPRQTRTGGLTLIELMIAMTIGLLLIAGAITVYLQSHSTLRSNESIARLQENARYVFDVIEPDIRMAQFWGLRSRADRIDGRAGPGDPPSPLAAARDCGSNWSVHLEQSITASNNAYAYTCAPYGTAVAGADTLTIRRAASVTASPAANALYVQTTRADKAALFSGTAPPSGFDPDTSETRELIISGYYVSHNSSLDAPGQPVPSLRRKFLRNGGSGPVIADEEVLPHVEDLQIRFGVDTDAPGTAMHGAIDRYVNPDDPLLDPASAGFDPNARILAVRIWLRLRGGQPEAGIPDGPVLEYADRQVAPIQDGFRRLLVSTTLFIRNAR